MGLALSVIRTAHADYVHPDSTMLNQREQFVRAQNALNQGDKAKFQQLAKTLQNYPLYPYLLYAAYTKQLPQLPDQTITQFLRSYPDSPVSDKLRMQWLPLLAKQNRWQMLIDNYQPSSNTAMRCLYLTARLQQGDSYYVFAELPSLWLTGRSQPNDCDKLFAEWKQAGQLSDALILKRMALALEAKQTDLAAYLLKWLNTNNLASGQLLLNTYKDPSLAAKNPAFGKTFAYDPDILVFAVKRLAKQDPSLAEKTWRSFATRVNFSPAQQHTLINAIAGGYTSKNPVIAGQWITKIDPNEVDEVIFAQQVRYALAQNNWPAVRQWIERMPKSYRAHPIWSYWYARAIEQQGYAPQAKAFYTSLADKPNYYGLLASNRLNRTYPIKTSTLIITTQDKAVVSQQANLIRARELYALKRYADGDREWWRGIETLNDKQRYIAAKLAQGSGWPSLALATTTKLTHQDDLSLKFPTAYLQPVAKQAKINNLQPSLIFAMIRQESLFQSTAISVAGARGLMQLMPGTAKYMAEKLNVSVPTFTNNLHDPSINIHLGSAYLNRLLQSYQDHPILAIASYNAGPGRIKSWLPPRASLPMDIWVETIPFQETREYVKYVVTYTLIYQYVLGEKPNIAPYVQDIPPVGHFNK